MKLILSVYLQKKQSMKNKLLFGIFVLFLGAFCLVGCNEDSGKWYDKMPDGAPFHTGNFLRFLYVDEDGNDLIDPKDYSTLPVSSLVELNSQPVIESLYKEHSYNDNYNSVEYNEHKGLHEFFTFAFGDSRQSDFTFYVYYKGVADKMEVTYQYQGHKEDGDYYSSIISWKVNGVEVYDNRNLVMRRYVRLVKKSDGTTEVSIDKQD